MKIKTINKNIRDKITEWANSIDNEYLRDEVIKESVVTGGCIASMLLKEKVNDYDVYLTNPRLAFELATYYIDKLETKNNYRLSIRLTFEDYIAADEFKRSPLYKRIGNNEIKSTLSGDECRVDESRKVFWEDKAIVNSDILILDPLSCDHDLMKHFISVTRVEIFVKSSGIAEDSSFVDTGNEDEQDASVDSHGYKPVFLSSNAITLTDKIQVVLRFTGKPEEIHETYDFVHATNYWTAKTGVVTNKQALEALLARELVYRGSKYPLASIFRTKKFINRDWSIHMGNYVKMAIQLNEMDLTDPVVLEEQLTGVDMLYMKDVIHVIKEKLDQDPDFEFNSLYLCEICDRLMGIRSEGPL